jgi:signal peptidase II
MRSGLKWVWIAVLVFILDWITKTLALRHLIEYTPLEMTSFFNFTLSYNTGAAFSFLHDASGWQTWVFGVLAVTVSIAILIWMKRLPASERWVSIALAFIIGGAMGNFFDRIYYGHVIDFIQVHIGGWYYPVFNVADSAVCVGAVMLLWDALRKKRV